MRCQYCHKLIIHRFNGRYTRMDKERKRQHMRLCRNTPRNILRDIGTGRKHAHRLREKISIDK